ncbi:MAG: hypothetical protein RBT45_08000 [Acholeplasmataceae bacterium]|jgi:hypothetical protein|nr:hypothetical protein [Acholeplasmataceae bacterium]
MTKMTRKLILAVLTVVVTVATLGTTTFAWFTLTNTSVIQDFEVDIIQDAGIEIAVADLATLPEDLVWRTTLTTADILAYLDATYGGQPLFTHVTSEDGRTFRTLGIGAIGDVTSSGYVEIPLHFRSNSADEIAWDQVSLTSGVVQYRPAVPFVDSLGVSRTTAATYPTDAADAMRISITGTVDAALTTHVYENPALNTNTVLGGLSGANLTNGGVGVNGAVNFYYESTNTLPGGADSVTTVSTVTSLAPGVGLKVLTMDSGQSAIHDQEYYGTIVIRIWLEGWDAEALNGILGRTITTGFRFIAAA